MGWCGERTDYKGFWTVAEVGVLNTDLRAQLDAAQTRRQDLLAANRSDRTALDAIREQRVRQTQSVADQVVTSQPASGIRAELADARTFLSDLQSGRRNVSDEQTRRELIRFADQGLVDLARTDPRAAEIADPVGRLRVDAGDSPTATGDVRVPGAGAGPAPAFDRAEATQDAIDRRQQATVTRQTREDRADALAEARRQDEFTGRIETRREIGRQDLETEIQSDVDIQQFYADQELDRRNFIDAATRIETQRAIDQTLSDREFVADIQLERERDGAAFVDALQREDLRIADIDRVLDDRAVARQPLERADFGADPLAESDARRDFIASLEDRIRAAESNDGQLRRAAEAQAATDAAIARATGVEVGLPALPAPAEAAGDPFAPTARSAGGEAPLLNELGPPDPLNAQVPTAGDIVEASAEDLASPDQPAAAGPDVRAENTQTALEALRQERLDDRDFRERQFFDQQAIAQQLADDAVEAAIFDPGAPSGTVVSVSG
jgi:hypothetical protein